MLAKNVELKNKTVLVTGAAGFVGANLVMELIRKNSPIRIIGLDNMNAYYDVSIKEYRLSEIERLVADSEDSSFEFIRGDISDNGQVVSVFEKYRPSVVVNLAAQAGVRYSITNPGAYIESNIIGFYNILEA